MFFRYFIAFSLIFLSVGVKAKTKEPTDREMLARFMVSMAQEGKTIRGVLGLLKNNIPRSEYENTLKWCCCT